LRTKREHLRSLAAGCTALLLAGALTAQPSTDVKSWPVTATTWTPEAAPGPESAAVSEPLPFIGIAPCRLADTRRSDLPTGYGVPQMAAGSPRPFIVTGRPHCLIPSTAQAVSLNVTVIRPTATGYLSVYPTGLAAPPTVATLTFQRDAVLANAAIVALGSDGGATVLVAGANADVVIDVNGYFAPAPPTWQPGDGGRLYTSGGIILGRDLWIGNNDQNSDPFWIERYNSGPNKSELRVNVGDDTQAEDKFAVGSYFSGDGLWKPRLVVQTDGKVGIGTANPQETLQIEGRVKATSLLAGDVLFNQDGQPVWRLWADATGVFLRNLGTGKTYTVPLQEVGAASP